MSIGLFNSVDTPSIFRVEVNAEIYFSCVLFKLTEDAGFEVEEVVFGEVLECATTDAYAGRGGHSWLSLGVREIEREKGNMLYK